MLPRSRVLGAPQHDYSRLQALGFKVLSSAGPSRVLGQAWAAEGLEVSLHSSIGKQALYLSLLALQANDIEGALVDFENVIATEPKNYVGDNMSRVTPIFQVTQYNVACCYSMLDQVRTSQARSALVAINPNINHEACISWDCLVRNECDSSHFLSNYGLDQVRTGEDQTQREVNCYVTNAPSVELKWSNDTALFDSPHLPARSAPTAIHPISSAVMDLVMSSALLGSALIVIDPNINSEACIP